MCTASKEFKICSFLNSTSFPKKTKLHPTHAFQAILAQIVYFAARVFIVLFSLLFILQQVSSLYYFLHCLLYSKCLHCFIFCTVYFVPSVACFKSPRIKCLFWLKLSPRRHANELLSHRLGGSGYKLPFYAQKLPFQAQKLPFWRRNCLFRLRNCLCRLRNCLFRLRNCLFILRNCLFRLRNCLLRIRNCLSCSETAFSDSETALSGSKTAFSGSETVFWGSETDFSGSETGRQYIKKGPV